MQFVKSFTDRTPIFSPDISAEALAEPFEARPGAMAFALAEAGGAVVGLVERAAVARALAQGQTGLAARALMTTAPLTIDADCTVREAIALLLAHPDRPEVFVATRDGAYAGLGSLRVLAQALLAYEAPGAEAPAASAAGGEELQRLLAGVEAEFRGHVEGLLAMADRLARQPLGPDALAQARSVRATGEALARLADDARDMLQARQGRLELKLRPEPLRAVMDEVQERWAARAREAGVAVLVAYDGDPDLAAMVDAGRLTQVFDVLIDNALRYTRQGSVEASLRARLDGQQVRIEGRVRDAAPTQGPACAGAETAARLPLTLTRSLLRSMGGALRTESNAGQGRTLLFQFAADLAGEPAPQEQDRAQAGGPHVLVVDDNATNRMVAEALCEMFDCTSETAEDGVEAVERARAGRFDLILMDIKMPNLDGIAATQAIRALDGPAARVPVVALTANVDPEDARSYLAAGMCCVVEKPIKPERLLQAINIALASARAEPSPDSEAAAA